MKRVALAALLLAACARVERTKLPLPPDLRLTTLDGARLTPGAMRGQPWVIELWLPG